MGMNKKIVALILTVVMSSALFCCGKADEHYPLDMGFKMTDITKKTDMPEILVWDKYGVFEYTWQGKANSELYADFEYYYNDDLSQSDSKYFFTRADENADTHIEVYSYIDFMDDENHLDPCIKQTIKLGDGNCAFECGSVTVDILSRCIDENAGGEDAGDYEFKCKKNGNGCYVEVNINGRYSAVCEITPVSGSVKKCEAASYLFDRRKILGYVGNSYNEEFDKSEVFPDDMPFNIGSPTPESEHKFYQDGDIIGSLWTLRHEGRCRVKCEHPIAPEFFQYYNFELSTVYDASYLSVFADGNRYCHEMIDVYLTDRDVAPYIFQRTTILNAKEIFSDVKGDVCADIIYYPYNAEEAVEHDIEFNIGKSKIFYPAAIYFYVEALIDGKVVLRSHINTEKGSRLTKYEVANFIYDSYKVLTP